MGDLKQDLLNVRTSSTSQYQKILETQQMPPELITALLENGILGDQDDLNLLRKRQNDPNNANKAKEATLLRTLEEVAQTKPSTTNTTSTTSTTSTTDAKTPQPWTPQSRFKSPGDKALEEVEAGKRTLKNGDGGPAVGEVQKLLRQAGFEESKYGEDQRFGKNTEAKVREFQEAKKLDVKVKGQVDAVTLKALREAAQAEEQKKASTQSQTTQGQTNNGQTTQVTNGQTTQVTNGQTTQGQTTNGQTTQVTNGQTTQVTNGQTTQGQTNNGQTTQVTNGQTTQGQTNNGQTTQVTNGQTTQVTNGQTTQVTNGQTTQGQTVNDVKSPTPSAALTEQVKQDSAALNRAIEANDNDSISAILARQSPESMKQMRETYDAQNGQGALAARLRKQASGYPTRAELWAGMVNPPPRSTEPATDQKAAVDGEAFRVALNKRDGAQLAQIMGAQTPDQMRKMDDYLQTKYGRGLYQQIWDNGVMSSDTNTSLRLLANARMGERTGDPTNDAEAARLDAAALRWAMDGAGTDEQLVSFVLAKQTPESMKQVRDTFNGVNGAGALDAWLKGDADDKESEAVWRAMANATPYNQTPATPQQAAADATKLREAIAARDIDAVNRLLFGQSPAQMRAMADYLASSGVPLERLIQSARTSNPEAKIFSQDAITALLFMVQQRLART